MFTLGSPVINIGISAEQRAKLPENNCCHWAGVAKRPRHRVWCLIWPQGFYHWPGSRAQLQPPFPKHTVMQASSACPPPEVVPESRLKTPWSVHGLRENYFSAWNGLVKHRDENFYHDTDCFIVFCHSFTVPFIQWFLLTHEKGMKRGSIFVAFSHGESIRYHNCADEKREKILT